MDYPTLEDTVGNTPLVRLTRINAGRNNTLLAKLEGNNPAGSVKDRPAMMMLAEAQRRGDIAPGDTLIEATSGNTGIALAMAAAIMGYRMVLIMPENASQERKHAMAAYGATLIEASKEGGMEQARDIANAMIARGEGKPLDQFANPDNALSHYRTTGAEVWQQTGGTVTHFVSSMGTTGTIMGVSRYLKEQNPDVEIIGLQPEDGASIAGIRRWPEAYLPSIFDASRVDTTLDIGQAEAEEHMRRLAREEGILAGVSSGGSLAGALRIAEQVENAVIVFIVCDRGDRYLSTGLYAPEV
ncbi:cysteine synthase CysM [Halomonas cibimaris]|uniref:Cysteine synthase n=1 Tax=Halomonas cibimaris TaxID=657012 RepID=A0ABP7L3I0_9GAMM